MHPTPDEQLQAVLRRLDEVDAEPSLLPPPARQALDDARRLLRRLERSWAQRLPFLVADNRLAVDLLGDLAPLLPDLSAEIDAAATEHSSLDSVTHEPTAHDLNTRLQALLGRAVHLLPDSDDGDVGRARIADHLRSRLAADPTLNRTPTDRLPRQEPLA
jgi:hypothetical protein